MSAHRRLLVWLLPIVILELLSSCTLVPTERVYTIRQEWYRINPNTLLKSIKEKTSDAFVLLDSPPDDLQSSWNSNWKQEDFLTIANALHEFVWNESLESWNLYKIDFRLTCDKIGVGYYNAHFAYYKILTIDGQKTRIVHEITIDPDSNSTIVLEKEYSPVVMNWPAIEEKRIKISVDEAIRIAEYNGGFKARAEVNNSCYISIYLSPGAVEQKKWTISYQKSRSEKIFRIEINPYTGVAK
ncbi:MAG: hypothetical protein PGMFKBFP_02955 [Anaerolineales bacterium]|nr:hypothetical protein [Anaerolineales bacterium]